MDVLTNLFDEMYLSGEVVARFDLTAPWGITMPPQDGIFHAIDQGECWIRAASDGQLFKVAAGDLVVFPEGAAHDLVDAPSSLARPLQEALCGRAENSFVCPYGGGVGSKTTLICGVFHFRDGEYHAFHSLLPPVLHVRGGEGEMTQWLRLTLRRLSEEAAVASPGAYTLISRLTDMIFIEGVRAWLKTQAGETAGWLRALNDPVIGRALGHIHDEPGRQWTIASLATEVGLSRSAFAGHFTRLVGQPPLRYLTSWRMQLARNWLRGTSMGLWEVADRLGYSSEDAFKRAFKREVGEPPWSYRRHARAGTDAA